MKQKMSTGRGLQLKIKMPFQANELIPGNVMRVLRAGGCKWADLCPEVETEGGLCDLQDVPATPRRHSTSILSTY